MKNRDLIDALINNESPKATFLKNYIGKEKDNNADIDDETLSFLTTSYNIENSRFTNFVNNQIHGGILNHIDNNRWNDLCSILRSLPDSIKESVKKEENEKIKNLMETFSEDIKEFLNLTMEERRKALNYIRGSSELVKDFIGLSQKEKEEAINSIKEKKETE